MENLIENLRQQIKACIADGQTALAQRKTNALEKLLSTQSQTTKTQSPIEAMKQRREDRDRLFAELERRLERLQTKEKP